MSRPIHSDFLVLEAEEKDLLIKCRSVVDGDHLVDEVSWIEH